MEKVLQRAKYAERQALKRTKKRREYLENGEAWARKNANQRLAKNHGQNFVAARKNRQMDWSLGALAPRRDIGERAVSYGAYDIMDFQLPEVGEKEQPHFIPVTEGDRVVVIKGRDTGKIGQVSMVQRDRMAVRVDGVNLVDVEVPSYAQQEGETRKVQAVPRSIPIGHVCLVYALPDPASGVPRDVVIERLEGIKKVNDVTLKHQTGHRYERYIPGTNTIIPWPEQAENKEESMDGDTEIISVEDRTFRPYLLAAPMPTSVIDELRNKYSKFRTRHDPEYIEKKEAEAERVERRKNLGKTMRTPLQELAELRAKQNKAAERELSDEQLAEIGKVIEREEAKAMGWAKEQGSSQPLSQ